jgi:hypothetical protein
MKWKTLCVVCLTFAVAGCGNHPAQPATRAPTKFESTFAKPDWFDSVAAPDLATPEQVTKLWQSEKRCCGKYDEQVFKNNRIFYKSCFNAISAHYEDERLVVLCLSTMDVGAEAPERVQLARFLVDNFASHKASVENCANCMPADTVARTTLDLARYESRESNNKLGPVGRLEKLLDTREDEISYWVQAEIYEFLGELYLEAGVTPDRLSRYKTAFDRLNRLKEVNEPLNRRFEPVQKNYDLMIKLAQLPEQ